MKKKEFNSVQHSEKQRHFAQNSPKAQCKGFIIQCRRTKKDRWTKGHRYIWQYAHEIELHRTQILLKLCKRRDKCAEAPGSDKCWSVYAVISQNENIFLSSEADGD